MPPLVSPVLHLVRPRVNLISLITSTGSLFLSQEGVACLIKHRITEGVNLARRACRLSSYYSCVNDRAIRGYASAVYAAAERFVGNQDGARQHLTDALEVRLQFTYSRHPLSALAIHQH